MPGRRPKWSIFLYAKFVNTVSCQSCSETGLLQLPLGAGSQQATAGLPESQPARRSGAQGGPAALESGTGACSRGRGSGHGMVDGHLLPCRGVDRRQALRDALPDSFFERGVRLRDVRLGHMQSEQLGTCMHTICSMAKQAQPLIPTDT